MVVGGAPLLAVPAGGLAVGHRLRALLCGSKEIPHYGSVFRCGVLIKIDGGVVVNLNFGRSVRFPAIQEVKWRE